MSQVTGIYRRVPHSRVRTLVLSVLVGVCIGHTALSLVLAVHAAVCDGAK